MQHHQPVALMVRQRSQQYPIDHAEDRRVDADPKARVTIAARLKPGFLSRTLTP
jgi:hypothetical protein